MSLHTVKVGRADGVQTNFRATPQVNSLIKAACEASGRSQNAEINIRLLASFGEEPVIASPRLVPKNTSELLTEEELFELEEAARQNTRSLEQEILHRARMSLRTQS